MANNIKVALDEIRKENTSLQNAIEVFKTYDASYIEEILSALEGMHSDYINVLVRTIKNVADTNAPTLVEHAQEYSTAIKSSVDAFEEEDCEIAKEFDR